MKLKIIKDPVHGYIKLKPIEVKIVNSNHFQRLRNILQLSTTQMVYPGARHSRFEHSLGVFHLSNKIFENLESNCDKYTNGIKDTILPEIKDTLRSASLLHDIGHYPFSHLGEQFANVDELLTILENEGFIDECEKNGVFLFDDETSQIPKNKQIKSQLKARAAEHELASCALILSSGIKKIIDEELNLNPFEICAFILGESIEDKKQDTWQYSVAAQILNSKIDADKLDYIIRDHKMSGALLSGIDSERMIMAYTVCNKELVLSLKALSIINNFLLARESIYMWVCQHHKVVFSNTLLKRMISILPEETQKELFSFPNILNCNSDDNMVICKIREYMKGEDVNVNLMKEYYKIYTDRNYYLHSCWKHIIDFQETIKDEIIRKNIATDIKNNPNEVEKYLQEKLNLNQYETLVGLSEVRRLEPEELHDIRIEYNGRAITTADYDIYIPRNRFVRSVPYVYLPYKRVQDGIDFFKTYLKKDRINFSKKRNNKENKQNKSHSK